mmetsp:Transcript_2305/g.3216  ORF Transcript_2305/g.3216 Transcript_2305/m.3216 type:complete len:109 (-) Transcript_2305:256-582(-)
MGFISESKFYLLDIGLSDACQTNNNSEVSRMKCRLNWLLKCFICATIWKILLVSEEKSVFYILTTRQDKHVVLLCKQKYCLNNCSSNTLTSKIFWDKGMGYLKDYLEV